MINNQQQEEKVNADVKNVQDDAMQSKPKNNFEIEVQLVKKTKKNEPKILPALILVDKEAFESGGDDGTNKYIMKELWRSQNNKIIVAKKKSTGAILGYAIFSVNDLRDARFGKKWIKSCYLHRIAVRIKSQGQGIGKHLINFLLVNYPEHALSLDVRTDSLYAVNFYKRVGLKVQRIYVAEPDKIEFALMETVLDKSGRKIPSDYEIKLFEELTENGAQNNEGSVLTQRNASPVQKYFNDPQQCKQQVEGNNLDNTKEEEAKVQETELKIKVSKNKKKKGQGKAQIKHDLTTFDKVTDSVTVNQYNLDNDQLKNQKMVDADTEATEQVVFDNQVVNDGNDSTKSSQDNLLDSEREFSKQSKQERTQNEVNGNEFGQTIQNFNENN